MPDNTPITYLPAWITDQDTVFAKLWYELPWIRHDKVPRRECYYNDVLVPYTYGTPPYDRTYSPTPDWHPVVRDLQTAVESYLGERMEVCFINGYEDGKDQLGWHADDSLEMDPNRSIAIVSLGAEREIWFRPNEKEATRQLDTEFGFNRELWAEGEEKRLFLMYREPEKVLLGHGSLCIMKPGCQQTHEHRIPKSHLNVCGPRISLTFRGFVSA